VSDNNAEELSEENSDAEGASVSDSEPTGAEEPASEASSGEQESELANGDEVAALERAFGRGDFALVRRLSDDLLARPDLDAKTAEIAGDYRRRVSTDPVQVMIVAGSLIFFALVVYIYVL